MALDTAATTKTLLDAGLNRSWARLAGELGVPVGRLVIMSLQAIRDPHIIAQYPVECRLLEERIQRNRRS